MLNDPAAIRAYTAMSRALREATLTALAMAAAAFVVGDLAFPMHWRWVVLSALLVNVGNRGRLDVVNKSALRVLGAGAQPRPSFRAHAFAPRRWKLPQAGD